MRNNVVLIDYVGLLWNTLSMGGLSKYLFESIYYLRKRDFVNYCAFYEILDLGSQQPSAGKGKGGYRPTQKCLFQFLIIFFGFICIKAGQFSAF